VAHSTYHYHIQRKRKPSFYKPSQNFKKRLPSSCLPVCPSVRPSTRNSAPTTRTFMTFYMSIFRKSVEKTPVSLKSDKNNGTVHKVQYTFLNISRSVLLRMRYVSCKSCRDNQNTHFLFHDFFFSKNLPFMR
jgi:hypothetical protein